MATVCDRVGFEDVLQGFDFYMERSTPSKPLYYSIWNGAKLKYISKEDDPDSARNEFEQILKVWQRNGTGGMLEARFHNKQPNNQLTNKSEYQGSMTFKLVDYNMQPAPGGVPQPGAVPQQPANPMATFLEQYQQFLQLQTLLAPPPTVGAADGEKDLWERIEGLLSTPIVEDIIAGAADKFGLNMSHYKRENYSMAGDTDAQQVASMEDLTENESLRLRRAIERLMVDEPDFVRMMERLADLKEKSPNKYNMAKAFL